MNYGLDRLKPHFDEPARLLHTLDAQVTPLDRLSLTAYQAWGQSIMLDEGGDLFDGLNLPSIALGQTRQTRLTARYSPGYGHSLSLNYLKADSIERVSITHDFRSIQQPYLLVHTELGNDLFTQSFFLDQRVEWLFDRPGDWRVGLRSRYEEDEWSIGMFLTIEDQWIIHPGGPTRTAQFDADPELYRGLLSPDTSGCVLGRVFIDIDADGLLDKAEPGIGGVRVRLFRTGRNDPIAHSITAADGSYYLGDLRPGQYFLVIDPQTLPANTTLTMPQESLHIKPAAEPIELHVEPICVSHDMPPAEPAPAMDVQILTPTPPDPLPSSP